MMPFDQFPPVPELRPDASSGEQAPEIGGPPQRTSVKTLVFTLLPIGIFLLLLGPQLLIGRATSPDQTSDVGQSGSLSPVFYFVVIVAGAFLASASWWARTFTVGMDELVIDEGVFTRRRRVVPFGRIQQIDIDQKLLAQVFRLGALTIETAGSSGGKVRLGMLDIGLARGIRRHALVRRAQINTPDAGTVADSLQRPAYPGMPPPPANQTQPGFRPGAATDGERVLLQLGPGQLAAAGLTHHFVAAGVPAVLLAGLAIGAIMVPSRSGVSVLAVLLGAVAVAVFVACVLVLIVFLQYVVGQHGYTLGEQGDDLHMRFGLLQVRNVTIPRHRVQHVTVSDNPLRRTLGLVSIRLHSAAPTTNANGTWLETLGSSNTGGTRTSFEIPVLARSELDGFLTALMGGDWHIPVLHPRPPAARRRAVIRRVGALGLIMVIPALMFPPGSLALLGVALVGIPWGLVAHRRAGHAGTDTNVVLARGVLHHRIDLIPVTKIQSAGCVSTPFQRIAGVDTFRVDIAGISQAPNLFDMDHATAVDGVRRLPRRSRPARSSSVVR